MRLTRLAPFLFGLGALALTLGHSPRCDAFVAAVHWDVTAEALTDDAVSRQVSGETLTFSDLAILQIQTANVAEDVDASADNAAHHFDNERLGDGSTRLKRLRGAIADALTGDAPDGFLARQRLGGAIHTLQDWYSHTNWVELGRTGIQEALGRRRVRNPSRKLVTCGPDRATLTPGLDGVTSGYFDLLDGCTAPAGKCLHGATGCDGINKDAEGRPGFAAARDLARLATIDFVNQVLDMPGVAGNAGAIRTLMGRSLAIALVVDDSVSATPALASVRSSVKDIVSAGAALEDGGGEFTLTTMGPGIGPVRRTKDRARFLSWIDALAPRGTAGDGAEPSMTALLRTVALARPGTTLFLVTDAACADPELAPAVAGLARTRGVQILAVLTGPDAQGDPCYRTVAETSGGVALRVPAASAGDGLDMLRALVTGQMDTVVAVEGTLAGPQTFTVPVECDVKRLVVTATVETGQSVEVKRPDGTPVADADPDASIVALTNGAVVQVTGPVDGDWTVRLDGSGRFSLRAWVDGKVGLRDVRFVTRTTARHAPLAPVPGLPAPGGTATLTAVVTGKTSQEAFVLVDAAGATLATPTLVQQDPDAGADRFVGSLTPPAQAFRVVVTGKDGTSCAFRRTLPALLGTSDVQIQVSPSQLAAGFTAGTTTTLTATIVNGGAAATFDLFAADDAARVTRVEPASLTLGAGASGTFEVDVRVPPTRRLGAPVTVTLAAVEQGGTRANTLTLTAPVTDGTLAIWLGRLSAHDRRKAGADSISAGGLLSFDASSGDARIDPATDATRIEVGDPSNPFFLVIPAGDAGWRTSPQGVLTWRSPRGEEPVVRLSIDPRRHVFSLNVSRFDFPARPGSAPRVTIWIGDDVGTAVRAQ